MSILDALVEKVYNYADRVERSFHFAKKISIRDFVLDRQLSRIQKSSPMHDIDNYQQAADILGGYFHEISEKFGLRHNPNLK